MSVVTDISQLWPEYEDRGCLLRIRAGKELLIQQQIYAHMGDDGGKCRIITCAVDVPFWDNINWSEETRTENCSWLSCSTEVGLYPVRNLLRGCLPWLEDFTILTCNESDSLLLQWMDGDLQEYRDPDTAFLKQLLGFYRSRL